MKTTPQSTLFAVLVFPALLIPYGCGDLSEVVVIQAPGRGGAVLVTEIAVLRNYSNAGAGDWDREPVFPSPIPDGIRTWIEHPPEGIFIPSGTKANIQNRQFLQDGKLVDPYPANSFDMQRNRAVEVVFVKIKDGPHRDVRGWMPMHFLHPTVVMP